MAPYDEAKKNRKVARAWLTRHTNTLEAELDRRDITAVELRALVEDFNRKAAHLEDTERALEFFIDEENIDSHIEEESNYISGKNRIKNRALVKIDALTAEDASEHSVHSAGGIQQPLAQVKLPKLDLPHFSGDVLEWTPFYDAFMAHIGDKDYIDPVTKFTHLLALLEDDAEKAVKGFKLTSANYQPALDHLKDRFGRPAFIKLKHINALLQLELPTGRGSDYVKGLWKMLSDINIHTRSLANLGMEGDQIEAILCPIIIGRFPKSFRDEWSRESKDHEGDLEHTLTFIKNEVERLERSEAFQPTGPGVKHTLEKVNQEKKKSSASASALVSTSEVSTDVCGFCKDHHRTYNCPTYKRARIHVRRQKVKDARLCFRCLQPHFASGCSVQCQRCEGPHHRSICSSPSNQGAHSSSNHNQGVAHVWRQASNVQVSNVQQPTQGSSSGPTQGNKPQGSNTQQVNGTSTIRSSAATLSGVDASLITSNIGNTATVLQTAKVIVKTPSGQVQATVLFDSAADRSYVTSSLVKLCQPKKICQDYVSYSSFGGERAQASVLTPVYDLHLLDMNGEPHILSAAEIPVICAPLARICVPNNILAHFSHLQMADDYGRNTSLQVDILVGLDFYWKLVGISPAIQKDGLVALPSVFGYLLGGQWTTTLAHQQSAQLLCCQRPCESSLANFWNLESVGITPKESMQGIIDKNPVLTKFNEELEYSPSLQRYQVALPLKKSCTPDDLVNNFGIAVKRLFSLHKRLEPEPEVLHDHYKVLYGYESEQMVERVPKEEIYKDRGVFYMPHRPIVKKGSKSSPVRPVFDCSSKSYNGLSLNDLFETGPSLNPDLVSIMIRFRCWPIALSGDVTKAFLQLYIKARFRDLHRFVILEGNSIVHMRFTRVPFGNTCSPFCLNAVVRFHLSSFPEDEVVQELRDNIYVDNYIGGADTEEMALDKYEKASKMLASAGLSLSKWSSNSKSVSELFFDSDVHSGNSTERVLGVKWSSLTDKFCFEGFDEQIEFVNTKRSVLSILSRIFDPLGFVSPFILKAKILFQLICRLGLDWDDPLPDEQANEYQAWLKDSRNLSNLEIQRPYFPHIPWTPNSGRVELIGFGDASEHAYGAIVYIRLYVDDKYMVYFVDARSRVAPMKKMSIPRLELLAALLCARLIEFVRTSLRLDNIKIYCYSDSTAIISWINSDPLQYKAFVANRLTEIQELVPPVCWLHVPGVYNPADIASRGAMASELTSSDYWFKGPSWLSQYVKFPKTDDVALLIVEEEFLEKSGLAPNSNIFNFESSSLTYVINCVARVLRFIHNCRSTPSNRLYGSLTSTETTAAQLQLWRCVQQERYGQEIAHLKSGKPILRTSSLCKLNPFLDDQGILRVTGRVENSDLCYSTKHPIIIPPGNISKLIIRDQHINMHHAGIETVITTLRKKFWIIHVHRQTKQIIKFCISCQRHDSRACNEIAAPLPRDRVSKAPPFYITGIDYAGPLFCKDYPSQKLYILLFTCGVVRALHLELTESLQTSEFIYALRRFTARRGVPARIYSDNARTFTSASTQMSTVFGVHAPEWIFITPRAPHHGGWWERLVRSVKSCLRKSLGQKCITKKELETILIEIEHTVNSRPLTRLYGQPGDEGPITPSHFLLEQPLERPLNDDLMPLSAAELSQKYHTRQFALSKFWKKWKEQYITNLPPVVQNFKNGSSVEVGDLVLIRDENIGSRLEWPLARVLRVYPGRDGRIRSVDVKTRKSVICRPIQKLHKLEVSKIPVSSFSPVTNDSDIEKSNYSYPINGNCIEIIEDIAQTPVTVINKPKVPSVEQKNCITRSGRLSKAPDRLGFK